MIKDNEFEWSQFIKLGEAIGDGLHHEDPWITKEYKRLAKILLPKSDYEKKLARIKRQERNQLTNKLIAIRLKKDKCLCGSPFKQVRSGSLKVICTNSDCKKYYRYKYKK